MPTTFWFLRVIALIALLVYAAMAALVWAVEPKPVEYSEPIAIELPPRTAGKPLDVVAEPARPGEEADAPATTGTAQ